ncbi:MAG: flagellar biosynthesis anti-sigma factor FlgM [Oscillospiraceae bacterium]
MTADNLKINGNTMGVWKSNVSSVKSAESSNSSVNRNNATRMDTFEISNHEIPAKPVQDNFALSEEIKNEKSNFVRELSQSHTDVNKFLEIKAQVRAGTYQINPKDVADNIMPFLDFDRLA